MHDAKTVVENDLDDICERLADELRRMAGQRLLITGGAGFLGYYLVQTALNWNKQCAPADRIEVVLCDNFIRGVPAWLSELRDDHLTLVKHDIIEPLPEDIGDFEYIIHAASIASPTYYRKHPIQTMDANVNGLRRMLDYCRARMTKGAGITGFLFFSSSEIYGDPPPDAVPTPETYLGNVSSTGPRACYDESKRYGETLCVNFAQQYAIPACIARPFNNYGPGLKITDRRALPDFARDVLEARDIALLSDGGPTRTFCYVADAVVGYFKILVRGRPGEAYNIGVEDPEISIAELAARVRRVAEELFDYRGQVVHGASSDKAYLTDNPRRRCPTIDKARRELVYAPQIGLDEGLRRSLIWYSNNRYAEAS